MDDQIWLRPDSGEEERAGSGCTRCRWQTEPVRLTVASPRREIRWPLDSALAGFEIVHGQNADEKPDHVRLRKRAVGPLVSLPVRYIGSTQRSP
jgi:hypothetical protein